MLLLVKPTMDELVGEDMRLAIFASARYTLSSALRVGKRASSTSN